MLSTGFKDGGHHAVSTEFLACVAYVLTNSMDADDELASYLRYSKPGCKKTQNFGFAACEEGLSTHQVGKVTAVGFVKQMDENSSAFLSIHDNREHSHLFTLSRGASHSDA